MLYFYIILGAIFLICIISLIAGAKWLKVRRYSVITPKLDNNDGILRILLISDLHEKSFGKNNSRLIEKIEAILPDMIVVAGDVADTYGKVGGSYEPLFEVLPKIAPTYLVLGNHEFSSHRDIEITGMATNAGIRLLDDECDTFRFGNDIINVIGLGDKARENIVCTPYAERLDYIPVTDFVKRFSILICHRPEELDAFAKRGIDLMLSGHTHGGQMRLPFLGGVFSPMTKKLFPKYDMGHYGIRDMNLVITSGLGASVIPLRLFNRPEIAVIDVEGEA